MTTSTTLLLSVCLAPGASDPQDELIRQLNHARHDVQQAMDLLPEEPQAATARLGSAADSLRRIADTHPAALEPADLLDEAAKRPRARKARELVGLADGQLAALRSAARARSAPTEAEQAEARRVIAEVLDRPEFKRSKWRDWLEERVQRILQAIGRLLTAAFPSLARASGLLQALSIVVVAILAGLLLYLLARILTAYVGSRLSSTRSSEALVAEDDVLLGRGPGAAEQALTEARQLASRGHWRASLRLVFAALLLGLDDRGLIDYRRETTNWDYVRTARRNAPPSVVGSLEAATRLFEARWYGLQTAAEADYAAMLRHLERTRQTAEGM